MSISMLTFNIWHGPQNMSERMEALGQIVQDLEPDILAFQEARPDSNLALLQKQRWFARYHLISPKAYSLVILSAFPVDKWKSYTFKNSPYKAWPVKLITAEINRTIPSTSRSVRFVIAATHLLPGSKRGFPILREEHLRESLRILSTYENVCAMGDMNIEDKTDGEVVLPLQWIDAWLALPGHTHSNGYTWDQSKNPFIPKWGGKDRLDRVFCKLSDFQVKEMRIVGDKLPAKSSILPSDHIGLFTVVEPSVKTEDKRNKHSKTENEVYFKRPPGWEKLIKQ